MILADEHHVRTGHSLCLILETYYDTSGNDKKTFVTPFLDENLLMEIDDDSGLYFYFHDCLGSVVNVVRFHDDSGWTHDTTKINRYVYYAFGAKRGGKLEGTNTKWDTNEPIQLQETYEPVNQDFEYTGRRFDDETGLMEYRASTYDPLLGRFLQLDPIGLSGGINRYCYIGNKVLAGGDPL